MKINDLPKDRKKYFAVVQSVLSGMANGMSFREVIDGYTLSYRITFYGDSTDFYIDTDGLFVYWNRDEGSVQFISREQLTKAFATYSRPSDEGL